MGFAPAIGAGLSIAKGITGAIGAGQQAAASSSNYMVQAQIAMNNAAIAGQNAEWETGMGEYKTAQTGLIGGAKVGGLVGQQARGGVDVNSGSPLAVREAATRAATQDVGVSVSDMARKVYGYRVQQSNFNNQASANVAGAGNARKAGRIAAVGSLLDGVAGAFGAGGGGKFLFGGGGDSGGGSDNGVGNDPAQFGIY